MARIVLLCAEPDFYAPPFLSSNKNRVPSLEPGLCKRENLKSTAKKLWERVLKTGNFVGDIPPPDCHQYTFSYNCLDPGRTYPVQGAVADSSVNLFNIYGRYMYMPGATSVGDSSHPKAVCFIFDFKEQKSVRDLVQTLQSNPQSLRDALKSVQCDRADIECTVPFIATFKPEDLIADNELSESQRNDMRIVIARSRINDLINELQQEISRCAFIRFFTDFNNTKMIKLTALKAIRDASTANMDFATFSETVRKYVDTHPQKNQILYTTRPLTSRTATLINKITKNNGEAFIVNHCLKP